MTTLKHGEVLIRHKGNPILTADMWPYTANSVMNPGVTRLRDGTTLLLCRVEDHRGHSHFCAARSKNGIDQWEIDAAPTLMPEPDKYPEELWGIEDARIVKIEGDGSQGQRAVLANSPQPAGKYAIVYTAYSFGGPCVSIALTEDFHTFERVGVVMPPSDKDATLLPKRVGDYWAMIHRPTSPIGTHIWLSFSPDLRHWGSHRIMLDARRGGWWDAGKVGMSAPPIETPRGWLMMYHGVRVTASGSIYRLGLALFDLATPEKCVLRGDSWFFGPEAPYERGGDVGNVVFPCGYTIADDGDGVNVYYGAADTSVALAHTKISTLLRWLDENGRSPSGKVEVAESMPEAPP
jgi:predicted GH43/DUF377 family glycosyl hydrolase